MAKVEAAKYEVKDENEKLRKETELRISTSKENNKLLSKGVSKCLRAKKLAL
ncbi:hypothetical protein Hanom_Chr06g00481971 [Helianthus anomalus]